MFAFNDINNVIERKHLIIKFMDDMVNKRKSLETAKARNNSRRPKPMAIKAGFTRKRTAYKDGGKIDK